MVQDHIDSLREKSDGLLDSSKLFHSVMQVKIRFPLPLNKSVDFSVKDLVGKSSLNNILWQT